MTQGYLLTDANSLNYAHRVGGTQLLDVYYEFATKEQRLLAITETVRDELGKNTTRGHEILKYIADKQIPIVPVPQTEQALRDGAPRKNAGERSILEVAARENTQGRNTLVWSDDKFFASTQELAKAPGIRHSNSADMLDRAFANGTIKGDFAGEMQYRRYIAAYQALPQIGSSTRLNTFEPPEPGLRVRIAGTSAADLAHAGVKAVGAAAVGVDAFITARETDHLLEQGNVTGAQSQVVHFGARAGGGAIGAAATGLALGSSVGPWGAAGGAIAGGVVGAVGADKLMDAVDQQHIYIQRGSDGNTWRYDERAGHGWMRMSTDEGPGRGGAPMRPVYANAPLADELNYKASSTAVELALAQAPNPKNPFSQPAAANDAHAADATPWTRDPTTRQWSRYVADPTQAAMGNPTGSTERATPQRSAELDRAAQATIAENLAHSRPAIAQRYQDAYEQYGWKQHGPVPAAVLSAEPAQSQTHSRAPVEQAPLRRFESEHAPVISVPKQPAHSPPVVAQPTTHESRVKPTRGGMSFAEAHKRRDEPEKISPGSLRPVDKLPKADRQHELTLLREIDIVNAKAEQELGKAQSPQRSLQPSMERTQERAQQPALQDTPAHRQATPQSQMPQAPYVQDSPLSRYERMVASADAALPAPSSHLGGSDIADARAQVAALEEQIARLTGQHGQGGSASRSASDERLAPQAGTVPRAEPVASARPMDPRDANHPDHQDFQKIYTAVAQNGRWDAKQSTNIASQVLTEFKAGPIGLRLDVVAIEPDLKGQLKVFAGHAPWGEHKGLMGTTVVDAAQAARVPAEQGFERLAQANPQHAFQQSRDPAQATSR